MLSQASLLALVMAAATAGPHGPQAVGHFQKRELSHHGQAHRYQVFVPAAHATGAPLPVILFLHGSGERGSDGEKQVAVGLGPYLREHLADFPALVVFPQSPEGRSWEGETAEVAIAALEESIRAYGGDPGRVYLSGISRGGYGTYAIALAQPRRFAALVPVCGGITSPRQHEPLQVDAAADEADPFEAAARRLANVPIWIFHGAQDDVVPPQQSRRLFAELQAVGGDVRYTEFPDANHNAWDAAYRHGPLWTWLFTQRLPQES